MSNCTGLRDWTMGEAPMNNCYDRIAELERKLAERDGELDRLRFKIRNLEAIKTGGVGPFHGVISIDGMPFDDVLELIKRHRAEGSTSPESCDLNAENIRLRGLVDRLREQKGEYKDRWAKERSNVYDLETKLRTQEVRHDTQLKAMRAQNDRLIDALADLETDA